MISWDSPVKQGGRSVLIDSSEVPKLTGCQPGIGVPAAAASGMITAASTLAPLWS
jgi:hypothetical protein